MARSGAAASLGLGCFLFLWGAAAGGAGPVEGSVPEVAEVELGETARIKCNFSPPGESNYDEINWFYIDRQIPKRVCSRNRGQVFQEDTEYKGRVEMDDFILAISRVTLQDARTFMCQVKAGSSVVAETQTQLHVYKTPEPPEIQVNDAGISVTSNEIPKIAVCVSKNGFPAPNITWYKNSSPLWQDEKQVNILSTLTKESSGLYTVSSTLYANVSREDRQSRYHCQLSYRLLGADRTVASEKVTVTVFYPTEVLRLEVQSPQPEVQEGDEVTLRCEGDGYPPPEYTLLKVKEDRQEEELPSSNGVLTLRKVRKEDSGQYVCRTLDLDSMATLDATAELSVNYLEGIKITPEGPIQLQQGDTLALTCDARGSKPLEFRWKKEKKGKLLGQSRQLKLSNVTHESSGSYSCEVAMEGVPGLARSRQVYVAVHGKPQINAKDSLVPVQQNEVVTLTCKAAALPEPTITWTVSGTVHNHSDHHRALSNLTVQVTPELLRSGVTCTATNKFGSSNHHIKLQLRTRTTPPPAGNTTEPIKKERKSQESKGVIIVAVIVCILVIAVLGAVLYFLHKKGKIPCGRTGKQDITRPDARKEEIVVEVKSDKLPEEAGLLQGANGEKRPAGDQAEKYIDLRN